MAGQRGPPIVTNRRNLGYLPPNRILTETIYLSNYLYGSETYSGLYGYALFTKGSQVLVLTNPA